MKLLTLDLSTTCTGYAVFVDKELMDYGIIKPNRKGLTKVVYPWKQLTVMRDLAESIVDLLWKERPDVVLIEEINKHKSRLSGKTLDGFHYILLHYIDLLTQPMGRPEIIFMDSDGKVGWRSLLGLRLSDSDKKENKVRRASNKMQLKGSHKLPIISKKHLAQRFVNTHYNLHFDLDNDSSESDMVDAIGLGTAFIMKESQ